MENGFESFSVPRFTKESGKSIVEETVAREVMATIYLNGEELSTLLCSPRELNYLAAGFLASEGLLAKKEEIKSMEVDDKLGVVRVETERGRDPDSRFFSRRLITSGCGGGATFYSVADAGLPKVESAMKISADDVFALVNQFQHGSELYLATHGVHSAALSDGKSILLFSDDIGRHNAVDKIFGRCLLEGVSTDGRVIISSGRISSEILHKVAKRGIPVVVSISVPTNMGIKIADELGITLIGSVRGKKMNVYANDWRVS